MYIPHHFHCSWSLFYCTVKVVQEIDRVYGILVVLCSIKENGDKTVVVSLRFDVAHLTDSLLEAIKVCQGGFTNGYHCFYYIL